MFLSKNGKDPNKITLNHHFYLWIALFTRPNGERGGEVALPESYTQSQTAAMSLRTVSKTLDLPEDPGNRLVSLIT